MKSLENFFSTSVLRMKRDNQLVFLFTFLFGLINFIYFVIYPISIAKESFLKGPILIFFEKLHGGWNHPILLFLGLFFVAISIILLKDIFSIKRKTSIFLLSILVTLFPVFHENTLYISSYLGITIAFLLSVYSLLYLRKKKVFLSILFMTIAFCIFPFTISIPISGIFLLSIHDLFQKEFYFQKIGSYLITIVMGIIVSQILFLLLSILIHNQYSIQINSFSSIISNGFAFFFQNSILQNHTLYRDIIHLFLFLGLGIFIITILFHMKGIYKLHFLLSCIFLFISISISTIFSTRLETCFGFLMLYLFFFMIIEYKNTIPIFKSFLCVFILILSFTYLISNQASYMSIRDQNLAYYAKYSMILHNTKMLNGYQGSLSYYFSDPIYYDSSLHKMSNRDYSLDYYQTKYIKEFLKEFFGENITFASSSLKKEILASNEYKMMKTGDIQILHNVIVVKTSNSCYYRKY